MRKETEQWVEIAKEDLAAAEYLLEKSLYKMVCYHSQQAVEKVLKAILIEHKIDFPRTHNILDLRDAVKTLGYEIKLTDEDAIFLNSVYRTRYPSELGLLPSGEPTLADAKRSLKHARAVINWMSTIQLD